MSDLPKGWTSAALGDVSEINPRVSSRPSEDIPVSFVGMADLNADSATTGQGHPRPFGEVSKGYTLFQRSDILVAKITPCFQNNKIGQADITYEYGAGSTEFHVIRPHQQQLDQRYLLHFLRRKEVLIAGEAQMTGSGGQRRVPPYFLRNLRVPLPPLEGQRRIATILDRASALDTAAVRGLELLETLADETFERYYQALPAKSSTTLEHIADIGSGITKGRKTPNGPLSEVPYLTVANVQDGKLALDTVKTIAVSEAERAKYALQHDDIVLTEGGDPDKLGRGTVWRSEIPGAIHQNHVFRVTPDPSAVISLYLSLALRSFNSKQYFLRSAKQTTGIATINKTQLRRTPLRVPPLNVQQGILDRMERIYSLRSAWENRRNSIAPLTQSLQSRAFRGEL